MTNIYKLNKESVRDLPSSLNNKTNLDLSNSPYTTNRILEIPQDIKLELSGGVVTLKAGSKVYAPNGFEQDETTPKFDVIDITTDLTSGYVSVNLNDAVLDVVFDRSTLQAIRLGVTTVHSNASGTSLPSGLTGLFYNTNTNEIDYYNNGNYSRVGSFPICVVSVSTTQQSGGGYITSIDQVFNGFGCVGSTAFVLPGIKVQFANGQNANGTCFTGIKTVDNVLTHTLNGTNPAYVVLRLYDNSLTLQHAYCSNIFFQQQMPSTTTNYVSWFDGIKWRVYYNGSWVENYWSLLVLAQDNFSSGKITSFLPYQVDSVANSNMSNISGAGRSFISTQSCMHGGIFISNSFATSTEFTAPSNGWFKFRGVSTASPSRCFMGNTSVYGIPAVGDDIPMSGAVRNIMLRVKKGDKVSFQYTNLNIAYDTGSGAWFFPDEGEV